MDLLVLAVFGVVYLGMVVGRLPGLALDRTGVALLGAMALVVAGRIEMPRVWDAVDTPTMALLFALMVVSSQFRMGGFYSEVVRRIGAMNVSPPMLLAILVGVSGVLSALLANDIVCLAMAPMLVEACARRRLDPIPFLLALACSANVGSAATLIGNPQNMLIGQVMHLSFAGYLAAASVPSVLGLFLTWAVIVRLHRFRWEKETVLSAASQAPAFDRWESSKGGAVLLVLVVAFLFAPVPRELVAMAGAGLLLCSRKMRSREFLALVDWQLLVLFVALFVVNRVMVTSGNLERMMGGIAGTGLDVSHPAWLFGLTVVLSNLVSNVPAVMLLLPSAAGDSAGYLLALASTLAGNLFIVGSIANIIVVDQAERMGVRIGWSTHARVGVPVTLLTLAVTALWLALVY